MCFDGNRIGAFVNEIAFRCLCFLYGVITVDDFAESEFAFAVCLFGFNFLAVFVKQRKGCSFNGIFCIAVSLGKLNFAFDPLIDNTGRIIISNRNGQSVIKNTEGINFVGLDMTNGRCCLLDNVIAIGKIIQIVNLIGGIVFHYLINGVFVRCNSTIAVDIFIDREYCSIQSDFLRWIVGIGRTQFDYGNITFDLCVADLAGLAFETANLYGCTVLANVSFINCFVTHIAFRRYGFIDKIGSIGKVIHFIGAGAFTLCILDFCHIANGFISFLVQFAVSVRIFEYTEGCSGQQFFGVLVNFFEVQSAVNRCVIDEFARLCTIADYRLAAFLVKLNGLIVGCNLKSKYGFAHNIAGRCFCFFDNVLALFQIEQFVTSCSSFG